MSKKSARRKPIKSKSRSAVDSTARRIARRALKLAGFTAVAGATAKGMEKWGGKKIRAAGQTVLGAPGLATSHLWGKAGALAEKSRERREGILERAEAAKNAPKDPKGAAGVTSTDGKQAQLFNMSRRRRRRRSRKRSRKCSRGQRKGSRVCKHKPGPKKHRRRRSRKSRRKSRKSRKSRRKCSRGQRKGSRVCKHKPGPKRRRRSRSRRRSLRR